MVYCGKPSKACERCRSRRTKCDRLEPACTQCNRLNVRCPGYRNEQDTQFRDESEAVRTKYSAFKTDSTAKAEDWATSSGQASEELIGVVRVPRSLFSISDNTAASIFFQEFVVEGRSETTTFFDTLPSLYRSTAPADPLVAIISALGLIFLAHVRSSQEALRFATTKYNAVVHAVMLELQATAGTVTDQILMVILLMGLYEDKDASFDSLEQWARHIRGALALLDLRGSAQLSTVFGRQVVINFRESAVVNCLARHCSVPQAIVKWSSLLDSHQSSEEISGSMLCRAIASFCHLQDCVRSPEGFGSLSDTILTAMSVDTELEDWRTMEEFERPYSSFQHQSASGMTFKGKYDNYHSILSVTRWNQYRSTRILTHTVLISQLERQNDQQIDDWSFNAIAQNQQRILDSQELIEMLSEDICTSVQYCLGMSLDADSLHVLPSVARAKLLLWPLYVASNNVCIADTTVIWIASIFHFLSHVPGIKKRSSLAKAMNSWPHGARQRASADASWVDLMLTKAKPIP